MKKDRRYHNRNETRVVPVLSALRTAREQQGITLKEFACRLGYTYKQVSYWECGRKWPTFEALNNWCDALGVTLTISTEHKHEGLSLRPDQRLHRRGMQGLARNGQSASA